MKTESIEINGRTYRVTQLPARVGRRIMLKLASALGAATSGGASGEAIERAIKAVDPDDFDRMCDDFAGSTKLMIATTTTKGPGEMPQDLSAIFDSHFAGNYTAMIKWLAFCLKLNFSDFFDGAAGLVNGLAAQPTENNGEPSGPPTE